MTIQTFFLIILGVLLNAAAQLFLKAGTNALGILTLQTSQLLTTLFRIAFQPFICLGLLCYVFSVGLWIIALSRTSVSIAYPMLSIGYIVTAIAAWTLFGETLSAYKIAGIIVIIFGVFLLSRA